MEENRSRQVAVFVKPNASKNRVTELKDGSLKVTVKAPPQNGQANAEVIRLVAKWAGVLQENVYIIKGQRGRKKTLQID